MIQEYCFNNTLTRRCWGAVTMARVCPVLACFILLLSSSIVCGEAPPAAPAGITGIVAATLPAQTSSGRYSLIELLGAVGKSYPQNFESRLGPVHVTG